MQTKRHVYKDNLILEHPDGSFTATFLKEPDEDIQSKECKSLEKAKAYIDTLADAPSGQKTLEDILREYFGCKKPFLNIPVPTNSDGDMRYLTRHGETAYCRLTCLLEDLAALGVLTNVSVAIDELDAIVRQEY